MSWKSPGLVWCRLRKSKWERKSTTRSRRTTATISGCDRYYKRQNQALILGLCLIILGCGSCNRPAGPQLLFERARLTFVHGNLAQSQKEASQGYEQFQTSNPEWAWRFKLLEAEAMLWRGLSKEALILLTDQSPDLHDPELTITQLASEAVAYTNIRQLAEAESRLAEADRLCAASDRLACGGVLRAYGKLALDRGQIEQSLGFFERSLSFARMHHDDFLEATALL